MLQNNLPDFDALLRLAAENPKALERLRQNLVSEVIESAPTEFQRRLHGLQFQIETHSKLAGSPMAACLKISQMMHQSFAELRYALNEPLDTYALDQKIAQDTTEKPQQAKVLSFPRR